MAKKEIKLSVKNLKISFRTDAGKVQAVRGISFDLYKGETLALVGESGSGKSVTNRAIMGILAGNAIKDGGEIIYGGQDLMKIPEEAFHKLRGDKIAMIFQDPMSSLNPIMRVGKQLTEAMLIKGKTSQKESRKDFSNTLSFLRENMNRARGENNAEIVAENKRKCADFNKFAYRHVQLENAYNRARESALDALAEIDDVIFRIEKNALNNVRRDISEIIRVACETYNKYVVCARADELKTILRALKRSTKLSFFERCVSFFNQFFGRAEKVGGERFDEKIVLQNLKKARDILSEAVSFTKPDFFAMGYYLTFSSEPLPEMRTEELNKFLRKYLDDNFMLDFIARAKEGIKYSNARSAENKIAENGAVDFERRTVEIIDYLKAKASGAAYKVTHRMAKARAIKLLEEVGIPEPRKRFKQYPFEFSGGMRQRIVIAIALSANPDILICDEPTTALDVTIQSQILELINKVKSERDLSVIFITHDLGVVANMADRVAVMYAGKIVEIGTAEDVFYSPAHPYTWALLSSMPDLDTKEKLEAIAGTPPNMVYPPKGDAFAERNKYAMEIDFEREPPMFKISETHFAATWLLHPDAPKVEPPEAVTARIERMRKARGLKV